MIKEMINSENDMNTTESTNTNIFRKPVADIYHAHQIIIGSIDYFMTMHGFI